MKRPLRNIVLGFLLLWLPVQGIAATGMAFCRHDHSAPTAAHTSMHDQGSIPSGHDCCPQHDSSSTSAQTLCDDCGYCHLGGAAALLPALVGMRNDAAFSFKFTSDTHFPLIFPEQPQRPPHARFS